MDLLIVSGRSRAANDARRGHRTVREAERHATPNRYDARVSTVAYGSRVSIADLYID